ncbi:hypothetical protein VH570_19550 [Sphingobium sp. HT1-2]|jgi:hypothetical protein|uniref:hypothetical protein n=1 Tax=Sphingobium sp. HT1-2 TaxID=3111640 RepID=UPI003C0661D1
MTVADLIFNPLLVVFAIYVAIVAVLAAAVHPMRRELMRLGNEMHSSEKLKGDDEETLLLLLDSATSFATGFLLILGILSSIIDDLLGRDVDDHSGIFETDPRSAAFILRWVCSVAAANPIAVLLWLPLAIVAIVLDGFITKKTASQAAWVPAIRAASAKMPSLHTA